MKPINAGKKILVIEDETDLLFMITERLRSWGYEPLTADTGEEGLERARVQQPDAILLDVMLPQMKGRDVCARLKADPATRRIPVIFLSALELPDHIKGGLDAGAEDYLIKPFQPEELKEHLEVCLARHSGSPPESSRPSVSS